MMMVRLNTQHELPQLATRTKQGRLDESGIIQPQVKGNNRQARSNKGATQPPHLSIDSYPSRKAYGFRNMTDFTAERGQKGISEAQSGTSRRSQEAWSRIDNGAKRGNDIVQESKSEIFADCKSQIVFELKTVTNPQIQGYQSEVVGEPDLGDVTAKIQTEASANIRYTPASAENYLENKGFIRHWISMGNYDITI